jgi:hypothetical protein
LNAESKPGAVDENVGCARDFAGRTRGEENGGRSQQQRATLATVPFRDGAADKY